MSKDSKSANRGEWSEVYVFFRLLGDCAIFPCDENLTRTDEVFPILRILRGNGGQSILTCKYDKESQVWRIADEESAEVVVNPAEGATEAMDLLKLIEANTLQHPKAYKFLQRIGVRSIKADSANKKDITLQICDARAGTDPVCGFSIKSYLGQPPTLLNSSGDCTNFLYEVSNISTQQVAELNEIEATKDLMDNLKEMGSSLNFVESCSPAFKANLRYIDSSMEALLGELVRLHYVEHLQSIHEATEILAKNDPLRFKDAGPYQEYVKRLLVAVSLGMTPGTIWNGTTDDTSGFLIVKPGGDVVTYHIYNRDAFKQYLYMFTNFDKPARERHKYGKLFEMDGKVYIKLNLQIRFTRMGR